MKRFNRLNSWMLLGRQFKGTMGNAKRLTRLMGSKVGDLWGCLGRNISVCRSKAKDLTPLNPAGNVKDLPPLVGRRKAKDLQIFCEYFISFSEFCPMGCIL
jgi:hypothetical protein